MAFDEALAERVRDLLAAREALTERRMFGGIAWMLGGNMACGVTGDELIVRLGPDEYEAALKEPHTRVFDLTGRTLRGFVCVGANATAGDRELAGWVDAGADFAHSLPPK